MADAEDGDERRERTLGCSATESQVETAVDLRHEEILAEAVHVQDDVRLLHIQSAAAKRKPVPPPDEIAKELLKTWDRTLAILAE